MTANQLHAWNVSLEEARKIQAALANQVIRHDDFGDIRTVAGVDIGLRQDTAKAAVVVLSFPELEPLEQVLVETPLAFPYIPGLLSFRETPPILAAFEKVQTTPDLIMTDGQGLAHPRLFGIAFHLGLLLDVPAIGCAKSRLYGRHQMPAEEAGSCEWLYDNDDSVIGAALRTRTKVKHVYISIGHRISLESAVETTLKCGRGYRLPEPTRLAHKVAAGETVVTRNTSDKQLALF